MKKWFCWIWLLTLYWAVDFCEERKNELKFWLIKFWLKLNFIMEIEWYQKVSKIEVIIRKRPLNNKEIKKGLHDSIEVHSGDSLILREKKVKLDMTKYLEEHHFTFDKTYDETVKNETLF